MPRSWPRFRSCPGPASAAGTEGGKAKPEIWKEQAKFKELSDKLVAETGKLAARPPRPRNLDTIKAAVALGRRHLQACHDSFRKDWRSRPRAQGRCGRLSGQASASSFSISLCSSAKSGSPT